MTETETADPEARELENLRQAVKFHVDRAERHRLRAEKAEAELEALRAEAHR